MYVCMYVCMQTCMHARMHTCTHACVCFFMFVCVCLYVRYAYMHLRFILVCTLVRLIGVCIHIRLIVVCIDTGWPRLIGSPKLQIIFHQRAIEYRSLLRKMTYKDKGSYESSPPCIYLRLCVYTANTHTHTHTRTRRGRMELKKGGAHTHTPTHNPTRTHSHCSTYQRHGAHDLGARAGNASQSKRRVPRRYS